MKESFYVVCGAIIFFFSPVLASEKKIEKKVAAVPVKQQSYQSPSGTYTVTQYKGGQARSCSGTSQTTAPGDCFQKINNKKEKKKK